MISGAALEWLNQLMRQALFLPEQASERAPRIDALHYVEITSMVGLAVGVGLLVLFSAWRFRRRPGRERGRRVRPPLWLELGTYAALLVFFVGLWVVGYRQYLDMSRPPDSALEIYVTAKQWMWKFSYPDGAGSVGTLYVPADRPVRLLLTSRDVIHSFYVPAFRLKRDVVPGVYTNTWFIATEPGRHDILCAEMCGNGHSRMRGKVTVLPPEEWREWVEGRREKEGRGSLVARGREAAVKQGCLECHAVDGTRHIGPTWKGAYGARVELQDGSRRAVDEAYLTRSMMDPAAELVAGFPDVMPSFRGQLSPPEVAALIEYIKSLRDQPEAAEPQSHGR